MKMQVKCLKKISDMMGILSFEDGCGMWKYASMEMRTRDIHKLCHSKKVHAFLKFL